ncbi:M48 family metalloprotease, partial [Alphaproteobacteria bacterium]|nr:M48 family metalloprotease [Alphaproteobacteria bacterium]
GANIFIYTGLIEKTKTPEELIGVLAHEIGHIEGGHLIATRDAFERASYESIVGAVLGIGAAILTGQGEAAGAIIAGSQGIAGRRVLAHTRINESAADQAALRYMDQAGINPQGLVSFFRTLESQELLPSDQQSEYMRTHPLTRNRIDAIENGGKASAAYGKPTPQKWQEDHARMKAKLMGFINPVAVPWTYDDRDQSVPALYARAIAAYRTDEVERSLKLMDQLLALEPSNPYFLELKGQVLVDYGRIEEALPIYRQSVSLLKKNSGLIRISLAHALLESGKDERLNEVIENLRAAMKDESRSSTTHRLLATAYGRQGHEVSAKLHLAEEAVLQRRFDYARVQAEFVADNTTSGSRENLQAQDILAYITHAKPKDK